MFITKNAKLGMMIFLVSVAMVGCSAVRNITGDIIATGFADHSKEGTYTKRDIGGKCYYSNGKWCHPCGWGGELRLCSEIKKILVPEKPFDGKEKGPRNLPNLQWKPCRGEGYAALRQTFDDMILVPDDQIVSFYHMDTWVPGIPHDSVFSLNLFDSASDTLDITYLEEFRNKFPNPGCYTDVNGNSATVEVLWVTGVAGDSVPDPVGVRIYGNTDIVADLLADSMESFTGGFTTDDDHDVQFLYDGTQMVVMYDGDIVYER